MSLLELYVGAKTIVSRVSDRNPEILRYLSELGIAPGTKLCLTERAPFDGPLMLEVGTNGEKKALGPRVAGEIRVVPPSLGTKPSG